MKYRVSHYIEYPYRNEVLQDQVLMEENEFKLYLANVVIAFAVTGQMKMVESSGCQAIRMPFYFTTAGGDNDTAIEVLEWAREEV